MEIKNGQIEAKMEIISLLIIDQIKLESDKNCEILDIFCYFQTSKVIASTKTTRSYLFGASQQGKTRLRVEE